MTPTRHRIVAAAIVAAAIVRPAPLRAGATSPKLVVSAATAVVGDGRRTVVIDAAYDFPNAVQVGYPLQLVVFQGSRFVRYPIGGAPVTGTSALLADGALDAADAAPLLAAGAPAPVDVRILTLTSTEARVALPAEFTAGPATVALYTILADGTTLSNPLGLVLP